MRTRTAVLAVLVLSLLALAAPAAASAAERTVAVEATATVKVPNDSASVGLGVTLERPSRSGALQAVSAKLKRVIATAQGFPGVAAGDIETGRVNVNRTERGPNPAYRASDGISVVLHEPAKAGDLINAAIGAGATGIRGPNYFVGNQEAAFSKALAAAFGKAKAKAQTLAVQAGATLGQALTINEGGGAEIIPYQDKAAAEAPACAAPEPQTKSAGAPVTAAKRTRAETSICASPSPPTKPGNSTVTATVGVVFALL